MPLSKGPNLTPPEVIMLPVIAGVGAVLLVLAGAKYLKDHSGHAPGPVEPPHTPDPIFEGPDGGTDGG